jgi:ADP-heptose:LPS heptosyltransferase
MSNLIKDCQKPPVLIHAGRWWPSKTLPKYWWQNIVNKLSKNLTPVLIGKTIDSNQGYQDIDCPTNGIDLRDLTTLDEYIALISIVPCLLSNDSSPIHIAGAFDNWIVTIPTCKHPDHILPWRNNTQYYKTKSLYKKLLVDDLEIRHTEFYPDTIDKIPNGHVIEEYLPDEDLVVSEIFDIYKDISGEVNITTSIIEKKKLKKKFMS